MKLRAITVAVVAGLTASGAAAQQFGRPEPYTYYAAVNTRLVSKPTSAEIAAAWPAEAKAKGLGGSAIVHCLADRAGDLSGCEVMRERSRGGFGAALLSLIPKFHLAPDAAGARPEQMDTYFTASWPLFDTPPDWQVKPKPGDFETTYTPAAWKSAGPGVAVMNCLESRIGALHDCVVFYQHPLGKGFGTMMLRFPGFVRLKPAMLDGKPIETGVTWAMNFGAANAVKAP